MTGRALLWFAVLAALLGAAPALAETRPSQPRTSDAIQKGKDASPGTQPRPANPRPATAKPKPFLGGSQEGTGI